MTVISTGVLHAAVDPEAATAFTWEYAVAAVGFGVFLAGLLLLAAWWVRRIDRRVDQRINLAVHQALHPNVRILNDQRKDTA